MRDERGLVRNPLRLVFNAGSIGWRVPGFRLAATETSIERTATTLLPALQA